MRRMLGQACERGYRSVILLRREDLEKPEVREFVGKHPPMLVVEQTDSALLAAAYQWLSVNGCVLAFTTLHGGIEEIKAV